MAIQTTETVLPVATPESAGIDPERLAKLDALIEGHIAEGRYPGAQIAVARDGRLVRSASFGTSRGAEPASGSDLFLLFSQTKVIIASAVWQLVESGELRFADKISDHVPEFSANGKEDITLFQVITHQGGFPGAEVPPEAWADHELLRKTVSNFTLEWTPGSRIHYHGLSAHWVAVVLIEAVTGSDFRDYVRTGVIDPIGLGSRLFVGVDEENDARCVEMLTADEGGQRSGLMASLNTREFHAAGVPGGGGYATAEGMAALYQMLLAGGTLNGTRILGPRVIQLGTRNHTGDRVDESMGMPMHRGLGPHVRGTTPTIRGLGTIASPSTFGHGGAGTSYSWGDPESGVSFTYLTNKLAPEPWHSARLDRVSNIVHGSIVEV